MPRKKAPTRRKKDPPPDPMERVSRHLKLPRWLAEAIDARRLAGGANLGVAQQVTTDLLRLDDYRHALALATKEAE